MYLRMKISSVSFSELDGLIMRYEVCAVADVVVEKNNEKFTDKPTSSENKTAPL